MPKTTYTSVDQYIEAQPEAVRPTLERVRGILQKALPGAEEAISYQIPTYRLHGEYVVYFSAARKHFALYPVTDALSEALGDEVESRRAGKGTMQFPYADGVPARVIERVAKALAKEAVARAEAKAAKKSTVRKPPAKGV
jgi:uncharacterized protein YdhG (YjbR/CyaY superfamily)